MYDDFFELGEPSTGELVYEEIKKVLLGTVKQEFIDELEKLRKENEELRPFKEDKDRFERELLQAKADYNRKIKEAQISAENSVFEKLLGDRIVQAWKVKRDYIKPPKCNKCDDQRRLHFSSPSGKDMTEPCECDKATTIFKPVPALLARFRVNPSAHAKAQFRTDSFCDKPLYYWYSTEYDSLDQAEFCLSECSGVGADRHSDTLPFSELNEWHSIFTSLERCQEFCDYLTKKRTN